MSGITGCVGIGDEVTIPGMDVNVGIGGGWVVVDDTDSGVAVGVVTEVLQADKPINRMFVSSRLVFSPSFMFTSIPLTL